MLVQCFENQIRIDQALVDEYERVCAPFNKNRAEYLALTSGATGQSTSSEIYDALISGLKSEIDLYSNKNSIVMQAHKEGII